MGRLLFLGGSGFFGKSLLDSYGRGRLDVFGIDNIVVVARRATDLEGTNPALVDKSVHLVDADIFALTHLHECDLVVHAAASSDAARYSRNLRTEVRTIVDGTKHVLDLMTRLPHRPKFLYVSSGAVYGRQPRDVPRTSEEARYVDELEPAKRAYANAKREAEDHVRQYSRRYGIEASIARCFAFVGPWLYRDRHFAIGQFLDAAAKRQPVVLKTRHRVIRSYMYADDLVEWLMSISLSGSAACPTFNVGSDEPIALRDVAKMVADMTGVPVSMPPEDSSICDRYVPSTERATTMLGLTMRVPLMTSIARTLDAYESKDRLPNASSRASAFPQSTG